MTRYSVRAVGLLSAFAVVSSCASGEGAPPEVRPAPVLAAEAYGDSLLSGSGVSAVAGEVDVEGIPSESGMALVTGEADVERFRSESGMALVTGEADVERFRPESEMALVTADADVERFRSQSGMVLVTAEAYVDSLRSELGLPALAAAVAVDGRVVWAYASGWADSARGLRASTESAFRLGSISKLLTAALAVRLWEEGRLDLDRPVTELIPEAPDASPPITVRRLAGHLAGIRHYARAEYVSRDEFARVDESLGRFIGDPLVAPPGSRYAYSSYGYNLLGAVLERVAHNEFRALIRDQVTDPLGVDRIAASGPEPIENEVSHFSRNGEGDLVEAPVVSLSDRLPSGGYLGPVTDLARFGSTVFGWVSPEGRALFLTPMETDDGQGTGTGFGWRVGTDGAGRAIAHHGGDAMGGRAFLLASPNAAIGVALATNLNFAPIGEAEALRLVELVVR